MARVDPESSKTRAGAGDIGLALAVEALAAFGRGHEETELLELAHEVVGHGCALAELAFVDLVLVTEHADAPSARRSLDAPGPSSSSRITRSGRNSSRCSFGIVVSRSMSSGAKSRYPPRVRRGRDEP